MMQLWKAAHILFIYSSICIFIYQSKYDGLFIVNIFNVFSKITFVPHSNP